MKDISKLIPKPSIHPIIDALAGILDLGITYNIENNKEIFQSIENGSDYENIVKDWEAIKGDINNSFSEYVKQR